jgi:predicted SAM-dependent methyltransferase/GR25 family glycosyltransferase involved in LPS biosynthesis
MKTPLLLLCYNRPDLLLETIASIKKIKPSNIFVVCDGPNAKKESDTKLCLEVRKVIESCIDWDCKKNFDFRTSNYGCKNGVASAIDWFFEENEFGIILEDDITVGSDFFRFCDEMLALYKDNEKIHLISGSNFQSSRIWGESYYYFSKYAHIWGWATWKRVWNNYDLKMRDFSKHMHWGFLDAFFLTPEEKKYWTDIFVSAHESKVDTWDYQLIYSIWKNNGLCITPNINLTKNIGFDSRATHTINTNSPFAKMQLGKIDWSKPHPKKIEISHEADLFTSKNVFNIKIQTFTKTLSRDQFVARLLPATWNFPQKASSAPQSPILQQVLKPRLNLGCGAQVHPEWTNVDIMPQHPGAFNHDLNKPLPFADASFEVVYHSHVLEHLTKEQGKAFVAECYRVLKPGGILRVVVPDLETIALLYPENLDKAESGDGRASDRHKWMYDRRLLGRLLAESGFDRVAIRKAGESSILEFGKYFLDRMPDGSTRKPDSLFMEAFKP